MNNEQEEILETEPEKQPDAPGKTPDEIVQAHKRRTALVIYLAILFGVALLLVTFSMITQNQKLMDSSNSAIDRAVALQNENRELREKQHTLNDQVESLQAELETAKTQLQTEKKATEAAKTALEAEQKKTEELNASITELHQKLEQAKNAADLLLQAQTALGSGDETAFVEAMTALEPLQEYFGQEAAALYATLTESLPAEEE